MFRPGGGLIPPVIDIVLRNRPSLSRPPTIGETAIEAPYRLVISPGPEARFAHATDPVPADDDAQNVELWHSRLANIPADPTKPPDEKNARRRIVRAIWARDRDYVGDAWRSKADESNPAVFPLSHADPRVPGNNVDPPFLGSLDRFDRHRCDLAVGAEPGSAAAGISMCRSNLSSDPRNGGSTLLPGTRGSAWLSGKTAGLLSSALDLQASPT